MRYARGQAPPPPELELISCLDRFGVQAILGRQLNRREVVRMTYTEQVYRAVKAFDQAADLSRLNPDIMRLASHALKITYA